MWGKRPGAVEVDRAFSVHPHACGGNFAGKMDISFFCFRFIPTHVGETCVSFRSWRSHGRFIPTHVGETGSHHHPLLTPPVHPHACGGNALDKQGVEHARRFIPTHVGETGATFENQAESSVHPHACGGNKGLGAVVSIEKRFIPTHVGETAPCSHSP